MTRIIVAMAGAALLAACGGTASDKETVQTVSLQDDLMPVVQARCGACHYEGSDVEEAVEHGAYFTEKEHILSRVGTYIMAGDPENSGFVKVLSQEATVGHADLVMPPPGAAVEPWTAEELEMFRTWITEGANDN